ncbi:hypothetical protein GCM10009533_67590 [Saccharopolyspora spinosporotrichia]|uniref:Uncharacterized protein n=1 Tax=Saccharopolyspora erythraea TaxID=1836 RepID=A0ABP3P696_SACER
MCVGAGHLVADDFGGLDVAKTGMHDPAFRAVGGVLADDPAARPGFAGGPAVAVQLPQEFGGVDAVGIVQVPVQGGGSSVCRPGRQLKQEMPWCGGIFSP